MIPPKEIFHFQKRSPKKSRCLCVDVKKELLIGIIVLRVVLLLIRIGLLLVVVLLLFRLFLLVLCCIRIRRLDGLLLAAPLGLFRLLGLLLLGLLVVFVILFLALALACSFSALGQILPPPFGLGGNIASFSKLLVAGAPLRELLLVNLLSCQRIVIKRFLFLGRQCLPCLASRLAAISKRCTRRFAHDGRIARLHKEHVVGRGRARTAILVRVRLLFLWTRLFLSRCCCMAVFGCGCHC